MGTSPTFENIILHQIDSVILPSSKTFIIRDAFIYLMKMNDYYYIIRSNNNTIT